MSAERQERNYQDWQDYPDNNAPVVAAITRNAVTRADLARQLPGDSVILFFPDRVTAAQTLGDALPLVATDPVETPAPPVSFGGLVIDSLRLEVSWNGGVLQLTRLERQLLSCLATPPLRVWPYQNLYQSVWRDAWLGDTSAVHATVKRLRRKLEEAGVTVTLESVRGVGFRLGTSSRDPWPAAGVQQNASVAAEHRLPGEAVPNQAALAESLPGSALLGDPIPGAALLGESVPGAALLGEAVPG